MSAAVLRFTGDRWKPSVSWSFAEQRWVWTNEWFLYDAAGKQVFLKGAAVWKIAPPPDYPPRQHSSGIVA